VSGSAVERKWRDCLAQQPYIIRCDDTVDKRTQASIPESTHGKQHKLLSKIEVDVSVGQQLANPTALLISAVFMLRHLGEDETADLVIGALYQILEKGRIRTCDIGGTATTTEFIEAIAVRLDS